MCSRENVSEGGIYNYGVPLALLSAKGSNDFAEAGSAIAPAAGVI